MRLRFYRVLMGSLGVTFFLVGVAFVATFFLYQRPHSVPLVPTGPIGHYFVAFTGCALIGWAGGLVGAARAPLASRSVATMTIFVLILMALIRMVAWVIGDYAGWLGDMPRSEASALLLTALALIWLKPTHGQSHEAAVARREAAIAAREADARTEEGETP